MHPAVRPRTRGPKRTPRTACRLLAVLPYRMRLTVILSVFAPVIESVPFLRDHVDDAPFLIEVLSRCSKTRFSASSVARMQQAAAGGLEDVCGQSHHACLYAAGTFDSEIYIVSRCVSSRAHVVYYALGCHTPA